MGQNTKPNRTSLDDIRRRTKLAHEGQAYDLIRGKLADVLIEHLRNPYAINLHFAYAFVALKSAIADCDLAFGEAIRNKALVNLGLQDFKNMNKRR